MANPLEFSLSQFQVFVLVLIRIAGIVFSAPVLGNAAVPNLTKVSLAFVLSLILFPFTGPAVVVMPDSFFGYLWMGAREAVVGLVLGLFMSMMFFGVQLAGQMLDMQMGFGLINVINPILETQVPVLGFFFFIFTMLLFLAVNGHHMVLRFLALSFEQVPVGTVGLNADGMLDQFGHGLTDLFVVAVKAAAPALGVLIISTVGMGIVGRTVPQINLLIVGFPLKIALGMAVIALSGGFFLKLMLAVFDQTWRDVATVMGYFGGI